MENYQETISHRNQIQFWILKVHPLEVKKAFSGAKRTANT